LGQELSYRSRLGRTQLKKNATDSTVNSFYLLGAPR